MPYENIINNSLLETFLTQKNHKIITIFGPTWSGKTGLSLKIGQLLKKKGYFPFIISADSRQVYQKMDIGTGKISEKDRNTLPHLWLDIISPDKSFSVIDFQKNIENEQLWNNFIQYPLKNIPIICGGTGLYIDSLIFRRRYPEAKINKKRRAELENFRQKNGNEALWNLLFSLDPDYAKNLHPNNSSYIIRAIEVFEETGKSKQEAILPLELKFSTLFLTPYEDSEENRKKLYESINTRIEWMFTEGLVDEVRQIIRDFDKKAPGLLTIGYKEIMDFLSGKITQQESLELIQKHNRNYAKRQISWNKKYQKFIKTINY